MIKPRLNRNRVPLREVAALLGMALVVIGSSCGQTTSSTQPKPIAASSPTQAPASPPPGSPVPTKLLGVWFMHTPNPDPGLAVDGIINGKVKLTLTATTYRVEAINNNPTPFTPNSGAVVVNNTEIDFFSEVTGQPQCALHLPDDVGRYTWTLSGGVLHLATFKGSGYFGDPCGRLVLADQSYSRKP